MMEGSGAGSGTGSGSDPYLVITDPDPPSFADRETGQYFLTRHTLGHDSGNKYLAINFLRSIGISHWIVLKKMYQVHLPFFYLF
jgi:hypothetical protein